MTGFVLDKGKPSIARELGGYELEISLDSIFGSNADSGYGIIFAVGPDEFMGAGSGFRVRFKPKTPGPGRAGIGQVDEGILRDGKRLSTPTDESSIPAALRGSRISPWRRRSPIAVFPRERTLPAQAIPP